MYSKKYSNEGQQYLYTYDINKQDSKLWSDDFKHFYEDMKFLEDVTNIQEFHEYFGGILEDVTDQKINQFKSAIDTEMHLGHTKRSDIHFNSSKPSLNNFFGKKSWFKKMRYLKWDCNRYYNPTKYKYSKMALISAQVLFLVRSMLHESEFGVYFHFKRFKTACCLHKV